MPWTPRTRPRSATCSPASPYAFSDCSPIPTNWAAVKSLKAINTRARVASEEFGIHLTHVATGFATWPGPARTTPTEEKLDRVTSAAVRAPVLLRQVNVVVRPGSVYGFELMLTGEAQVNGVLLHLLDAQHGLHIDDVALLEHAADDAALFAALTRACTTALPGFAVSNETLLANFTYAEQPLVGDLDLRGCRVPGEQRPHRGPRGDDAAAGASQDGGPARRPRRPRPNPSLG